MAFIADDRNECVSCKVFLQSAYRGQKKDEIAAGLNDDSKHSEYLGCLENYEEDWDKCDRIRNIAEKYKPPTLVTLKETTSTGGQMNLGIFWPKAIWESRFGPLPKNKIQSYSFNGKKLLGRIEDENVHGCPIGCIRLTESCATSIQKETQLVDSSTSHRKEAAQETFDRTRAALANTVTAKESKNDDGEVVGVEVNIRGRGKLAAHNSETSSGDDWIAMVRAARPSTPGKADSDDDVDAKASAKKKASASNKRRASAPPEGSLPTKALVGMRKVYPSQQQREISGAQQVVRDAMAKVELSESVDGLKSLTEAGAASIEACLQKLGKKLEPASTYVLTWAPTASSEGLESGGSPARSSELGGKGEAVVTELQAVHAKLLPLKALVEAIATSRVAGSLQSSNMYLRAAKLRCEDSGLKCAPSVGQRILTQDCISYVREGAWLDLSAAISLQATGSEDSFSLRAMIKDEKVRTHVQEGVLMACLEDICKLETPLQDDLVGFCKALAPIEAVVAGEDCQHLCNRLQLTAEALQGGLADDSAADAVGDAMRGLRGMSKFTKHMLPYEKALKFVEAVDQMLRHLRLDKRCAKDLDLLLSMLSEKQPKLNIKARSGCVLTSIQERSLSWRTMFEMLVSVRRQGSPNFNLRNNAKLDEADSKMGSLVSTAVAKQAEQFWQSVRVPLEYIEKGCHDVCGGDEDEAVLKSLKMAPMLASFLPAKDSGLSNVMTAKEQSEHDERMGMYKGFFMTTEKYCKFVAEGNAVDVSNDEAVAFARGLASVDFDTFANENGLADVVILVTKIRSSFAEKACSKLHTACLQVGPLFASLAKAVAAKKNWRVHDFSWKLAEGFSQEKLNELTTMHGRLMEFIGEADTKVLKGFADFRHFGYSLTNSLPRVVRFAVLRSKVHISFEKLGIKEQQVASGSLQASFRLLLSLQADLALKPGMENCDNGMANFSAVLAQDLAVHKIWSNSLVAAMLKVVDFSQIDTLAAGLRTKIDEIVDAGEAIDGPSLLKLAKCAEAKQYKKALPDVEAAVEAFESESVALKESISDLVWDSAVEKTMETISAQLTGILAVKATFMVAQALFREVADDNARMDLVKTVRAGLDALRSGVELPAKLGLLFNKSEGP